MYIMSDYFKGKNFWKKNHLPSPFLQKFFQKSLILAIETNSASFLKCIFLGDFNS